MGILTETIKSAPVEVNVGIQLNIHMVAVIVVILRVLTSSVPVARVVDDVRVLLRAATRNRCPRRGGREQHHEQREGRP